MNVDHMFKLYQFVADFGNWHEDNDIGMYVQAPETGDTLFTASVDKKENGFFDLFFCITPLNNKEPLIMKDGVTYYPFDDTCEYVIENVKINSTYVAFRKDVEDYEPIVYYKGCIFAEGVIDEMPDFQKERLIDCFDEIKGEYPFK